MAARDDQEDFAAVRFGLGPARSGEDWSPEGMLASLHNLKPASLKYPPSQQRLLDNQTRLEALKAALKAKSGHDLEAAKASFNTYRHAQYIQDVDARIAWGVGVPSAFAERLLAFWSNHFTVSRLKGAVESLAAPFESEALLPNLAGRFADLLKAAEFHPAMLIFLDQKGSIGPNSPAGKNSGRGLNENLAREILELHTLGVHGGYTQADVTAFANIMTGWSVDPKTGLTAYFPNRAEPGSKRLLGRTVAPGGPSREDFGATLEALAAHPATARHVASKLVTHFISDTPPAAAIDTVEKRFLDTGGNLSQVYLALAQLPEARQRPGAKARTARDFLVAALRAAGVAPDLLTRPATNGRPSPLGYPAMQLLHQSYWTAPSPAGWPEAAAEWLSAVGLAARLQIIPRIVAQDRTSTPDEFLERALGATVSDTTRRVVNQASNRQEALALVLASPEFNRR